MAGPITISVVGDVRDLVRGVGSAKGELTGLGKVAQGVGRVVKTGLLAAGAGAVAFGIKAVRAASDAQQSAGATETVYKRFAKTVVDRSEEAAEAVGLSANEYRELANVLGASLKGAGVPLREVTDLTGKLEGRAADLAATFGGSTRQAIEAVGSLLRGEADPIEQYGVSIKQVDVNAALAAKGLGDLEGSARKQAEMQERVSILLDKTSDSAGAFRREAGTLAGQGQRLDATVEDLSARFGELLLPVLTDVARFARTDVIPQFERLAGWLEDNKSEISDTASAVRDGLLPPLKGLGDLVTGVAGALAGLPPELQSIVAQAGLAVVVIPKLSAALAGMKLTEVATGLQNAETRTAALTGVARTAAGVGGVLGLTTSLGALNSEASGTEKTLGVLGTTGSGALLGFSVGGPIGAAIGGGAGLLAGLWKATRDTNDAMADGQLKAQAYATQLDAIAAASGRARREEILRLLQMEDGLIPAANNLGIKTSTLIAYLNGNARAIRQVNGLWKGQTNILDGLNLNKVTAFLRDQGFEIRRHKSQLDEDNRALGRWDGKLGETAGKIRPANNAIKTLGKVNPDAQWVKIYGQQLTGVGDLGRTRQARNNEILKNETRKAKGDLKPFSSSVLDAIDGVASAARTGAARIGNDMGSGLTGGVLAWADDIAAAMRTAVRDAIAAGKHEADSHSPSRKTHQLGEDLGEGLRRGLADKAKANKNEAKKLIAGILGQLRSGIADVRHTLADLKRERAQAIAAVADAAKATANITQLGKLEDGTQTSGGIKADLQARLAAIKNFTAKLDLLVKAGLKGPALQQIIDAGVDAGTVTAEALLAGGAGEIGDIVRLQNQISSAASELGTHAAGDFNAAGIKANQSLLEGLLANENRLDDAAGKYARRLARKVTRKLLAAGLITKAEARKNLDALAGDVKTTGRSRVTTDALTGAAGRGRIAITLTAEERSQLERGRAVQLDLDAYRAAGGRGKTF